MALFSDYQCPACRFAEPALLEAVQKDGNIRLIYRDWPVFGARSEHAARVSLAAHVQGRYAAVHHALMTEPGQLDDDIVRAAATRSGADWRRIERDLAVHAGAIDRAISQTGWDAFALSLPGTPGYLIGPLLVVGAQTLSGFTRAFGEARRMARSANT